MSRLDNWQNNLSALIEESRHKPFDFPNWNCLEWAASGVKAVSGLDILEKYRGKYKTEKGAAKLLRQIDKVESSEELLSKYLSEPKGLAFARMGDIVLAKPNQAELELPSDMQLFGPVPGICYGTTSYFVGENGLVDVPTLSLGKALWVS
jgi:hypothetical protein